MQSWMSSNFGQIGPWTMELAALEHLKKSPYTNNGETLHGCFDPILLILAGNEDMLYIKTWMSSNFGQIPPIATELADIKRLKVDDSTFSWLILTRSFLNLQVARTCMISWMSSNLDHIEPSTTKAVAIECLKYSGGNGVSTFSRLLFLYFQVTKTCI